MCEARKTSLTVSQVLTLARRHVANGAAMESSARLCLADAVALHDAGDLAGARCAAVRSLRFSVGIAHADFIRAKV